MSLSLLTTRPWISSFTVRDASKSIAWRDKAVKKPWAVKDDVSVYQKMYLSQKDGTPILSWVSLKRKGHKEKHKKWGSARISCLALKGNFQICQTNCLYCSVVSLTLTQDVELYLRGEEGTSYRAANHHLTIHLSVHLCVSVCVEITFPPHRPAHRWNTAGGVD